MLVGDSGSNATIFDEVLPALSAKDDLAQMTPHSSGAVVRKYCLESPNDNILHMTMSPGRKQS